MSIVINHNPSDRELYQTDPRFHALVNLLEQIIHSVGGPIDSNYVYRAWRMAHDIRAQRDAEQRFEKRESGPSYSRNDP